MKLDLWKCESYSGHRRESCLGYGSTPRLSGLLASCLTPPMGRLPIPRFTSLGCRTTRPCSSIERNVVRSWSCLRGTNTGQWVARDLPNVVWFVCPCTVFIQTTLRSFAIGYEHRNIPGGFTSRSIPDSEKDSLGLIAYRRLRSFTFRPLHSRSQMMRYGMRPSGSDTT